MKIKTQKGRSNKIVGQTGEYLVAAELGRRGYIATTFTGNVPEFDILVANDKLKTFPIQVKTIRKKGGFQSIATKWMEIEIVQKTKQIIRKRVRLTNPNLICIMVVLGDRYGDDEFYLLTEKQLQELYVINQAYWLKIHKGIRPKKADSMHCAINASDLEAYRDNWNILKNL